MSVLIVAFTLGIRLRASFSAGWSPCGEAEKTGFLNVLFSGANEELLWV